ncbi:hypothetical protein D9613_011939 [Agrocybe pediades]|uniref:Uncharacterized protein n=1 Tax=Agrocybe pediades TaxID=84607 RepID=A0A8H4VJ38_9AGAR|nr:hypothetical protein D9613_011939 [Agrocybe pediades]
MTQHGSNGSRSLLSLVSSAITSEFFGPKAQKPQPDGLKRSCSMASLLLKQIRMDRKLENNITAAQQEHSVPDSVDHFNQNQTMADEDGGFPKDVGGPQAFQSSTSMKRDLFAEV